jgi:superfamily II DNA helicase RecQ
MKPDSKIIKMSPNRPNIKLIIKKVNSIESGFLPLVEAINEKKMVNSLIYCSSIKDVSVIYSFLTAEVSQANMFIEMFHSETEEKNKTDIIKKITSKDESFIIIATSALGMGIDICSCHCVIIYGLPYNMVDLWQQIGRVGRDGSTAEAIFLYRGHQMKSSDVDVKNLYTSATCRRMTALTPFLTKSELLLVKSSTGKHTCCDICTKQCDCNNCVSNPVETLYIDSEVGSDDSSSSSSGTISYEQDIGDFSEQEDM